jgi:ribonuclease HIII
MQTPEFERLSERCRAAGATLDFVREIQSGIQLISRRRGDQVTVCVYGGKRGVTIVIQGSITLKNELEDRVESPYCIWIGTDESGKGDFFGPLVVAGVRVDASLSNQLQSWGVKDSKVLTAGRIEQLDLKIRKACVYSVVHLEPPEYNTRHGKLRNVNAILGWAHAQVIEEILKKKGDAEAAIADQFGDESYIENELQHLGKKIQLIQRHRAEADPAVAAASIVARAGFVRSMDALSKTYDLDLPKGAGPEVVKAGTAFVAKHGREALRKVAKLHFKTLDLL